MPLSPVERKHYLPFGAQIRLAAKCGVSKGFVSKVVNDVDRPRTLRGWRTWRRVQVAIARELGVPVADAFAPFAPPPGLAEAMASRAPMPMARAA